MASSMYSSMGRPPQPTPSPVMAGRSPSAYTSLHFNSPPPPQSSSAQQRSPSSSSVLHHTNQSYRSPSSQHQNNYYQQQPGGAASSRSYSAVPSAAPTPPPELEFLKVSNPDVESLNRHLDDMMIIKEGVHTALGMPSRSSGGGSDGSGMFRSNVLLGALLSSPPTGMGPTVAWSEVEMRIADLSASVERCEAHWEVVKRAGQIERAEGFATAMRFGSEVAGGGGSSRSLSSHHHQGIQQQQHTAATTTSHSSIQRILPLGGRQSSAAPSRGASLGGVESRGSSMASLTSHWTNGGGRSHYTSRDVSYVTSEELHWRSCQRKWFQKVEAIITEGKFALLEARRLASDWRDRCLNWAGPLERAMADRNFDALLRAIGAVTSEAPQSLQEGFLKQAISDAKNFAQKMKDASEDGRAVIASQSDLAVWAYLDTYQPYLPVAVIMELRALAAKREEYKNRFQHGYPTAVESVATVHEAIGEDLVERKRRDEEDRLAREAANLRAKRASQADALTRIIKEFEASERDVRQFIMDDERKQRIMTTKTAIESEAAAMGIEAKRRPSSQRRLLSRSGPGSPTTSRSTPYTGGIDRASSIGVSIVPSPTAPSSTASSPRHSTVAISEGKRSPGVHLDAPTTTLSLGDKRKSSYALLNTRRSEPHFNTTAHMPFSHQQSLSRIPMVSSQASSTADLLGAASAAASRYLSREGSPTHQESESADGVSHAQNTLVLTSATSRMKLSHGHGYSGNTAIASITAASSPSSPLVKYSFRRSGGGPLQADGDGDDSSSSDEDGSPSSRFSGGGGAATTSLRDLL